MSYVGHRCDACRRLRGGRRVIIGLLAICGLLLSLTAVALAADTPVVPARGKVAGHGYGYWMERFWQNLFASGRLVPDACETLTVGERRVGLLSVGAAGPGPYSRTCTEPVGRPIYVQALTDECSNFSTDHNGFGTSVSELRRCARKQFPLTHTGAWVDGHPVALTRFITTTGAYPVHVPADNRFKIKRRKGVSVAYGSGLLLSGLGKGTHTIWVRANAPSLHIHIAFTYTVHVR